MANISLWKHVIVAPSQTLNLAALKAINASGLGLDEGVITNVPGFGAFYFDTASTATGDDINVIQPTSGTGRWLRLTQGNTFVDSSDDLVTDKVTINNIPVNPTDAANKNYVDAGLTGQSLKTSCRLTQQVGATTYPATYNNGASGVGATLTALSNGAFMFDSVAGVLGDRVLCRLQTAALQNGIYTITDVGSVSTPAVLTRAVDFDSTADAATGCLVAVTQGASEAGTLWGMTTQPPITFGTTAINFTIIGDGSQSLLKAQNLNDLPNKATSRTNLGLGTAAVQNIAFFLQNSLNLSDLPNFAAARTNLGLGTAAVQNVAFFLQSSQNLNDLPNKPTARTNLGLGTAAVQNIAFFLQASLNLSDLASVSAARTNLGLGSAALLNASDVLQSANNLTDLASIPTARTNLGLGTAALQAIAFFLQAGNNLSDLTSISTARTNLGLGSAALENSTDILQAANNLSDVASVSTARTNLGLGSAALLNTADVLQAANNLSDVANAATSRTNLGLGTAAVLSASALLQAANNLSDVLSAATSRTNLGLGTAAVANTPTFLQTMASNIFTASGTYTPTAGMKYVLVFAFAGGGAGGGATGGAAQSAAGGGGGGGALVISLLSAALIGASKTVTIGLAGTGGLGIDGNDGGSTSLGALIFAAGGMGGKAGTTSTPIVVGGAGGIIGNTGAFIFPGDPGGYNIVASITNAIGGRGGSSAWGGGVTGVLNSSGTPGIGFGGGGSGGAIVGIGTASGASGHDGAMMFIEFLAP